MHRRTCCPPWTPPSPVGVLLTAEREEVQHQTDFLSWRPISVCKSHLLPCSGHAICTLQRGVYLWLLRAAACAPAPPLCRGCWRSSTSALHSELAVHRCCSAREAGVGVCGGRDAGAHPRPAGQPHHHGQGARQRGVPAGAAAAPGKGLYRIFACLRAPTQTLRLGYSLPACIAPLRLAWVKVFSIVDIHSTAPMVC
jgi:hypothetical protein